MDQSTYRDLTSLSTDFFDQLGRKDHFGHRADSYTISIKIFLALSQKPMGLISSFNDWVMFSEKQR